MCRTETKTFTIPQDDMLVEKNMYTGQMPRRIAIGVFCPTPITKSRRLVQIFASDVRLLYCKPDVIINCLNKTL